MKGFLQGPERVATGSERGLEVQRVANKVIRNRLKTAAGSPDEAV